MDWLNKYLLRVLIVAGALLLFVATYLLSVISNTKLLEELGKALMGLAFTAIFGGIVKLIFDSYQQQKILDDKKEDFRLSVLNQLRKVFDNVDSARLIIAAHESAKTYSEKIQQNIIPSIVALYDIKRSLVDSKDVFDDTKLIELRINIHYMIAYLQALAEEYKTGYLAISNKQFFHERLKERFRDRFVENHLEAHPGEFYTEETLKNVEIPAPSTWVWNSMIKQKHMTLFVENKYASPYRKMFVDYYEDSKQILKGRERSQSAGEKRERFPTWRPYKRSGTTFNTAEAFMKELDKHAKEGTLEKGDDLVAKLVRDLNNQTK